MKPKALSVRQPWASLIVHDIKDIENRSTLKNYRGDCYIHASKTVDKAGFERLKELVEQRTTINKERGPGGKYNLKFMT